MKIKNIKILKFFGYTAIDKDAFVDQPISEWIRALIWKHTSIKGFCWKHFRFKTAKLFKWQGTCFECWVLPKPESQLFMEEAYDSLPEEWKASLETKIALISVKPFRVIAMNPFLMPMDYVEGRRSWQEIRPRAYSTSPR